MNHYVVSIMYKDGAGKQFAIFDNLTDALRLLYQERPKAKRLCVYKVLLYMEGKEDHA